MVIMNTATEMGPSPGGPICRQPMDLPPRSGRQVMPAVVHRRNRLGMQGLVVLLRIRWWRPGSPSTGRAREQEQQSIASVF
jgi:hypothetical protein